MHIAANMPDIDDPDAEPLVQSLRIFNIFDIDKNGRIDLNELKVICKSINIHPTVKELKLMITEVSDAEDFTLTFEQFRAMRVLNKACELNVIAEFKKFDIHKLQRGLITKECVRKVFRAEMIEMKHPLVGKEGFSQELDKRVAVIMGFDSDKDGVVTFKDFYDCMLRKVPQEWLKWIAQNIKKGVREDYILMSLEMNGIEH